MSVDWFEGATRQAGNSVGVSSLEFAEGPAEHFVGMRGISETMGTHLCDGHVNYLDE